MPPVQKKKYATTSATKSSTKTFSNFVWLKATVVEYCTKNEITTRRCEPKDEPMLTLRNLIGSVFALFVSL